MLPVQMKSDVKLGDIIAGKYRIEKVLGRGGMGVVLSAMHLHLRQRVALKFLTDEAADNPEAISRFLREARLAVQIQSEHVARVTDVGTLESGMPYMVMEYLAGQDLKQTSEAGPLPIQDAVDYVMQACDAVAEAHALGIVHRDLKPANLFLTRRPDGTALVKVLDFGISKTFSGSDGTSMNMTSSTAVMGSPQYMSPEQIRSSRNVDGRSDIWSLGTILHELISGSPAYDAETLPGLLAKIIADPPSRLSDSNPNIRPELEHIVATCLQKDLAQRYATVSELAQQLRPFASVEVAPLAARIARLLTGTGSLDQEPISHEATGTIPPVVPQAEPQAVPAATAPAIRTHSTWSKTDNRSSGASSSPPRARQIALGLAVGSVAAAGWFALNAPGTPAAKSLSLANSPAASGQNSLTGPARKKTTASPQVVPVAQALQAPTVVEPTAGDSSVTRSKAKLEVNSELNSEPNSETHTDETRRAVFKASGSRLTGAKTSKRKAKRSARKLRARKKISGTKRRKSQRRSRIRATLPKTPAPASNDADSLDLFDDTK